MSDKNMEQFNPCNQNRPRAYFMIVMMIMNSVDSVYLW